MEQADKLDGITRSDSSMDDCNDTADTTPLRPKYGSDSSMDDCN